MEPRGRHTLKVLEGCLKPLSRTPAVRFINQEDSHSVKRWGTPIFDIFVRIPVRQARSYVQLKSKNVAMVRRRWVD